MAGTRIVDVTDDATFSLLPPCADPTFDHRGCDYWEDADRGSKTRRADAGGPGARPTAAPAPRALADNPFAPPARSADAFNPFLAGGDDASDDNPFLPRRPARPSLPADAP